MEESRRGTRSVTRSVRLISPKINRKSIISQMEMEVLRVTMGFNLLKASVCDYVTRFVGLIPHTPLDSMIHGPPV